VLILTSTTFFEKGTFWHYSNWTGCNDFNQICLAVEFIILINANSNNFTGNDIWDHNNPPIHKIITADIHVTFFFLILYPLSHSFFLGTPKYWPFECLASLASTFRLEYALMSTQPLPTPKLVNVSTVKKSSL